MKGGICVVTTEINPEVLADRLVPCPTLPGLPEGCYVLGYLQLPQPHLARILVYWSEKTYQPFVVWTYNRSIPGGGSGHYFIYREDAVKFFLNPDEM
jgi:hypothetical protein